MKRAIVIAAVCLVVAAAVAAGWWYANENPDVLVLAQEELDGAVQELGLEPEEEPPGIVASGFVEADEASVTTELGGRIVALHAGEGDEVVAGATLVELDDALLQAQIEMAQADLGVMEAPGPGESWRTPGDAGPRPGTAGPGPGGPGGRARGLGGCPGHAGQSPGAGSGHYGGTGPRREPGPAYQAGGSAGQFGPGRP